MNEQKQKYMKTGPASKWVGVSRRWLTELADKGELPFAQVGTRTRLFAVEDLEAWIAKHTIGGAI